MKNKIEWEWNCENEYVIIQGDCVQKEISN